MPFHKRIFPSIIPEKRRSRDVISFHTAAIVGVGLIGSSLARVLKRDGLAETVVGAGRSQKTLDTALELGVVDAAFTDVKVAVRDADIVFVCTPVGVIGDIVNDCAPAMKKGAILTDVGSVKSAIAALNVPDCVRFVPAHPVAGTENRDPKTVSPNCSKDAGVF